jgi:Ca2+ transporting ATPase
MVTHPDSVFVLGAPTNKTYLYTVVFQVFVFMQIFNLINARKLGSDTYNVFEGFFDNWMFLMIFGISIVV